MAISHSETRDLPSCNSCASITIYRVLPPEDFTTFTLSAIGTSAPKLHTHLDCTHVVSHGRRFVFEVFAAGLSARLVVILSSRKWEKLAAWRSRWRPGRSRNAGHTRNERPSQHRKIAIPHKGGRTGFQTNIRRPIFGHRPDTVWKGKFFVHLVDKRISLQFVYIGVYDFIRMHILKSQCDLIRVQG